MKKITAIFAILLLGSFLTVGNVMAFSYTDDYWTHALSSSTFLINLENAAYESDFGLFSYSDPTNRIEVFDKNEERGAFQIVYFQDNGGWEVSLDNSTWTSFDEVFGFYYGVYTGGASDTSLDYLWFTDKKYNQYADGTPVDTGIEHIRTTFDGTYTVIIELDDQLGGGDRDFTDMTVIGSPLTPAPVPEPATMLLLGTGLIGLAGAGRKKLFKK